MIEFCGEMSAGRRYIIKKQYWLGFLAGAITSLIFLVPIIYLALRWEAIVLLFVPPIALLPFFAGIPPSKKDIGLIIPQSIVFDTEEESIIWKSDKNETVKYIGDVVLVTDMGEFYVLKFRFGAKDIRFVCEKSLLCQGTIEGFEKIFEEKLVKKS